MGLQDIGLLLFQGQHVEIPDILNHPLNDHYV